MRMSMSRRNKILHALCLNLDAYGHGLAVFGPLDSAGSCRAYSGPPVRLVGTDGTARFASRTLLNSCALGGNELLDSVMSTDGLPQAHHIWSLLLSMYTTA